MAITITVENFYAVTPELVWQAAKRFDDLAILSAGSVAYRGLPSAPVQQGDIVDFDVKPFYSATWKPYRVEMIEVNDTDRRFISLERGAGVRSWRHTMTILAKNGGALQIDSIEIDAGILTPLVAWMAKRMYRQRDKPRRKILGIN